MIRTGVLPLPKRKEGEVKKAILAFLKFLPGITAFNMNVGAAGGEHKGKRWFVRFGFPGLSDIIGWHSELVRVRICANPTCRDGDLERDVFGGLNADCHYHRAPRARWLAIEVKRPGESATREQLAFLDLVRLAGGIAFVARSVEDVATGLRDAGVRV